MFCERFVIVVWCDAFVIIVLSDEPRQNQRARVLVKVIKDPPPPPVILLLAVPRQPFWFGSLVILDVVCCYLLLYINIEIGKNRC